MLLYRPTGLKELQLVYESGMREWPPRLPEQPIFYPVLNYPYAAQIARDWNTKSNYFVGYVTRFEVEDSYLNQFERQIVGGQRHEELWIPAEQLGEFNRHIVGRINVTGAFFGVQFKGLIPERGMLAGKDAIEQFVLLGALSTGNLMDFHQEIKLNHLAVFLHYPFWQQHDFSEQGVDRQKQTKILEMIETAWTIDQAKISLPDTKVIDN
jgi:hypothetical protein